MASNPYILTFLGLIVGCVGSLVGVGGGFFMVPYFMLGLGWSRLQAVGTSLAVVTANATSGAIGFAWQKRVDFKVGFILAVATLPGTWLGQLALERIPPGPFKLAFAAMVALAAWLLIGVKRSEASGLSSFQRGMVRHQVDRFGHASDYAIHVPSAMLVSIGVGFLSKLFGVGGGFIHVPLLILLYGVPTHVAMATSHFVLAITAAAGTIEAALAQQVEVYTAACMGVGALIGAQIGARFAAHVSSRALRKCLAAVLVLVAVSMTWSGLGPFAGRP